MVYGKLDRALTDVWSGLYVFPRAFSIKPIYQFAPEASENLGCRVL